VDGRECRECRECRAESGRGRDSPQIGSLLIGHRTYYPANSAEGEPYGGLWTGPMFVYTNEDPSTAADGFTFVSGDISSAVAKAADAAGAGYVVILGAATARKCLEAGLLDEILVHVVPVLIGDGVRLFDHPGGTNVHLEPIKVTYTPPATNMWWRVK
jgi:dihydrofolate reductase